MRVVIAVGGFHRLGAVQAADLLAQGWRAQAPADEVQPWPCSDGSEGFVEVVAEHLTRRDGPEAVSATPVVVSGPGGDPVPASYLIADEPRYHASTPNGPAARTAYIEAAQAAGRHLVADADLAEPDELSSAGVGELIAHARAAGATRIVVGCGDLASHDGGSGLARALAAGSGAGQTAPTGQPGLAEVREAYRGVELVLAHSTGLPLLGFHGSSAALGSEHGVAVAVTQRLEERMGRWSDAVERDIPPATDLLTGRRMRVARQAGSGVGGGVGFLLLSLGARAVPGAQFIAERTALPAALPGALVVTGGGIYDWRSISDGVVATVAGAALEQAAPTVVLADEVAVGRREGMSLGIAGSYQRRPEEALQDLAARVARTWSPR